MKEKILDMNILEQKVKEFVAAINHMLALCFLQAPRLLVQNKWRP